MSTDTYILDAWKHPHGRGEDRRTFTVQGVPEKRLPPRAWGRLFAGVLQHGIANPHGRGKTEPLEVPVSVMPETPHGRGKALLVNTVRVPARKHPTGVRRPDNMPIADQQVKHPTAWEDSFAES
ncbi:MAG: hypothetical protein HS120_04105 [Burkholderiales bacterium]|nr:hypothetical protein [Burkholderiales bacterium]